MDKESPLTKDAAAVAEAGPKTPEAQEPSKEQQVKTAEYEAGNSLADAKAVLEEMKAMNLDELDDATKQEVANSIKAQEEAVKKLEGDLAGTKEAEEPEAAGENPEEAELRGKLEALTDVDYMKDVKANKIYDEQALAMLKKEDPYKLKDKLTAINESSSQYEETTRLMLMDFLKKIGLPVSDQENTKVYNQFFNEGDYAKLESSFYNLTDEQQEKIKKSLKEAIQNGDLEKIKNRYQESNAKHQDLGITSEAIGNNDFATHARSAFMNGMMETSSILKLARELAKKTGLLEGEADVDKNVEEETQRQEYQRNFKEFIKNNGKILASYEDLQKQLNPQQIREIDHLVEAYAKKGMVPFFDFPGQGKLVFLDENKNLVATSAENMPEEIKNAYNEEDTSEKDLLWEKAKKLGTFSKIGFNSSIHNAIFERFVKQS